MDSLPVELLRLIFEYCDATTVQHLRLASSTLATVGYDYLIPPHFTSVEWRDDVKRLHSIASHDQLRSSIESITFNFAKVDEYSARHTSFFQHWLQEPEERNEILQDAWTRYYETEERGRGLPSFSSRGSLVEEAFKNIPRLTDLEITYTKCPYDIDVLKDVFLVRNCRKRDRVQACKNMNVIVSAIRHVRLSSLTIDQLPLELFKVADDRRHWFDCARSFASLSQLDLIIDPPPNLLPQARFRAINGLGHVLQFSPNLTRLSLGFHTYHNPLAKFALRFEDLLADFTFKKLTDLKLEGISCAEHDLRSFLTRHSATLARLRLGGRGLAKPYEMSIGGIHLYEGTWRSFFASLQGKLPRLERFHMEGDCEAGEIRTTSREVYKFHAVTDDNWGRPAATRPLRKTIDCLELERYLLRGGEYPKLAVPDD
ncbi:hypothetical protein CONLIGDRAFT_374627 [Coniochaeta ligniaria NRRL 30616]|uniref:F-box domain-containing protein n=1 Tax=Coniochaeta ligniaria NRRL 30616 TaxID=1408157 RepID=A0A1J7J504_9PEZI|nr:hypothetical protein CONLIGDRAFT_374627 [Coniochaeta ligniaria NRRL 30616]